MERLDIYENFNGKLFADHFIYVTVYSPAFTTGAEMQLFYRGIEMGIVKIEAIKSFSFSRLNDVVSYLNCGRSSHYQAALLNRQHNSGETLPADQLIIKCAIGYVERHMENHAALLEDWINSKKIMLS